jgi:hypothetical protein
MTSNRLVVMLELNEINFEYLSHYLKKDQLPNFKQLIEQSGFCKTTSEREYEHLEPWIQWVTAHTGKSFDEHKIFRLGDVRQFEVRQIWEDLEDRKNITVGALSPMNAKNQLKNPLFFLPDPWTSTEVSGSWLLKKLYKAVSQVVNDNAQSKITLSSACILVVGLLVYSDPRNWGSYIRYLLSAKKAPWRKALLFDLFLADVFKKLWRKGRPNFSSLFLNAGAHIQHHYLFSAEAYRGESKNPTWYVNAGYDPLLDVLKLYDHILGEIFSLSKDLRVMMATGLTQVPYLKTLFYYRLKDHAKFLRKAKVSFVAVEPRMSRDFLVTCQHEDEARAAQARLESMRAVDGTAIFEVDNRGRDLFVMLTYPNEIPKGFKIFANTETFNSFEEDVALVGIKNGHHHAEGYFLDSGVEKKDLPNSFPLADLPRRVHQAFESA